MKKRLFGDSGVKVSDVGLGCWQLGGDCWGNIDDQRAYEILSTAIDNGINFLDTADVYGNGQSELLIGNFLKGCSEEIFVATKLGRGEMWPDNYNETTVRMAIEASLKRLGVECLDLIQLHCIPGTVLREGDIFEWLNKLRNEGKIKRFGASVESVEEALVCLEQENLSSLQIIFNIFRQKPINELFPKVKKKNVAIIVRLPLASGLLTGKMRKNQSFPPNDHRYFNRDGQYFNVGETFAGLPFEIGVELADELLQYVPKEMTMSQMALRWILDYDVVSTVIPGASQPSQVSTNALASDLSNLSSDMHQKFSTFYQQRVVKHIRGSY
ncbi:MAG: aldo/keto reductase [Okeania sp. SIO3H1]|uniref:aldo/keto reductase n=1 Tax=Okeania sp. SIO1I7 TaxID=2607772 RepID=UPI0013CD2A15|nr:aldo/keto reductase [Okeania sp. SIO1I7]NEN90440.1 aldo/keto reductase [Okeania sp. SIO3H1]NET29838.1 aldo/keto reductase [Okeania sp. SIO1I7]